MSTKTKFAAIALAALTLAGGLAVTSTEAQARGGRKALAIGLGAALVGAAIANSYDRGYRHCYWTTRYNDYDEPIRVKVCAED